MKNKNIFFAFILLAGLILFRIIYSGRMYYSFLIWNSILAIIPYILSQYALSKNHRTTFKIMLCSLCILFLPNALYLISDFEHLVERPPIPFFFDIIVLFYAAFLGLFLNVLSLGNLRSIFLSYSREKYANIFIGLLILLSGFGVYLGRYLRWNSWDLFTQPKALIICCAERIFQPHIYTYTWAVSIGYAFILAFAYLLMNQSSLIQSKTNHEK